MYIYSTIEILVVLSVLSVLGKPAENVKSGTEIFQSNLQKIFENHPLQSSTNENSNLKGTNTVKKCKNKSAKLEFSSKIRPRNNNAFADAEDEDEDSENCGFAEVVIPKCGVRNPNGLGARVLHGEESEIYEFPWVVALLKVQKTSAAMRHLFLCGGSLIHPSVILTIAHCVQKHKNDIEDIKVRAGEWDFSNTDEMIPAQDRVAKKIIIHEKFNKGSLVNDIALIILKEPYELHRNINPICLPNEGLNFDYKTCTTAGWGKDQMSTAGKYSQILTKIDLPIVPNDQCQESLRTELGSHYKLNPSFLCAGGEVGKDTCTGDGGSPLTCPIFGKKNQYYQIGSVSWGVGCGGAVPGVYSNLMHLRSWIDTKMVAEGFNADYYTNI